MCVETIHFELSSFPFQVLDAGSDVDLESREGMSQDS